MELPNEILYYYIFPHCAIEASKLNKYWREWAVSGYLLKDPRVNPTNEILQELCWKGYYNMVKILLTDTRVTPVDKCSWCLNSPIIEDHCEIVKLLLTDTRVDPNYQEQCVGYLHKNGERLVDNSNCPLSTACQYGCVKCVQFLLQHPKIHPSIYSNTCLKYAIKKRNHIIAELLINHENFTMYSHINNYLTYGCGMLVDAVKNEDVEMIKLLLEYDIGICPEDINDCGECSDLIKTAVKLGDAKIMRALMHDGNFYRKFINMVQEALNSSDEEDSDSDRYVIIDG